MEITEKELESMIYDAALTPEGRQFLFERGLYVKGKMLRQVNLGDYGIADLLTIEYIGREKLHIGEESEAMYRRIGVTIYELKKGSVGANALMQAHRYSIGVREHFYSIFKRPDGKKSRFVLSTRVFLIGDDYDAGDFIYTANMLDKVEVFTYEFCYDGLYFNHLHEGYLSERQVNKKLSDDLKFELREFIAPSEDRLVTNLINEV